MSGSLRIITRQELHNMNDPHIQAFTILSDRISTLEEKIDALFERKRLKELTAVGTLDNQFLQFPFRLIRWPSGCQPSGGERRERAASAKAKYIILSFGEEPGWGHGEHCSEVETFTSDEMDRTIACEDGSGTCVRCDRANITSHFSYVCWEALARRLQKAVLSFCDTFVDVHLVENTCESLALMIWARDDVAIDHLLRVTLQLLSKAGANLGKLDQVDVYTCSLALFQAHKRFCEKPQSLRPGELRTLCQHAFFTELVY